MYKNKSKYIKKDYKHKSVFYLITVPTKLFKHSKLKKLVISYRKLTLKLL